ncbi:MAG TPA: hypothetical protein VM689_05885 [Aliidongia sp.]|nr:hypothetical protein [Aliidongia sp.]
MAVALEPTMAASPLAFLADEELAPLEVGHIAFDPNSGLLTRTDKRAPIEFGFCFAGHAFEAEASQGQGDVVLDCAAVVGRLPYTIEDRQRRAELNRTLLALNGSGLKWQIDKDQLIRVGIRIHVDPPATAPRLVVAVVEHLLPVKGYFELLSELARPRKAGKALLKPEGEAAQAG